MIETAKMSGIGRPLLSAAVPLILFLTSCGKKESATETSSAAQAVAAPELPVNAPRELEKYKDPKGAFDSAQVKSNLTNSVQPASSTAGGGCSSTLRG